MVLTVLGGEDKPSHSPRLPDGLREVRGKQLCRLGNSMEDWRAGHCSSHSLLSAESGHPALREQLKGILLGALRPLLCPIPSQYPLPQGLLQLVSVLCPATLSERCVELSAEIVMIVLGLEACGRVGQPGSRAGREELAGRKSALRTGLPGLMPWQFILVLGCLHWGYYNKSQHC